jgi:uncharacterized protein (TIGR02231 family)
MKIFSKLLLLLPCLPAAHCATPVESTITAATVYSDRAVVTRTATVDLAMGENLLLFDNLPLSLMEDSLQFSGHGSASATILDVNAESSVVETVTNEKVKALEDDLAANKRQIRALDDRVAVLNTERDYVKGMLNSATGPGSGGRDAAVAPRPSLEDWQKLYAYSDDTLGKISSEVRSIDDQRTDLNAKKAVIEGQLDSMRGARTKSVMRVKVRVDAATAGKFDVALKYAIPGVSWVPTYTARLNSEERSVELGYFGMVRNGTGEDWKDIALTLSTAKPGLGGGAPELPPWIVDIRQPEEVTTLGGFSFENEKRLKAQVETSKRARSPAPDNGPLSASRDEGSLAVFEVQAAVAMNATSATFLIPGTVSVPANNSMQRVSISAAKLAATLQYDAAPRLMETAFLSAGVANTTDYPFLAGLMNTFLDGTFIASSRMKTVMPGEKFDLHLGADEGIAVKRKLVNRLTENTGLTGGGRRVTYDFLLTFTNNKRATERLTFRERIPVSRQEKIEVKLLAPEEDAVGTKENPKEVTRDEEGLLVWRFELRPAEKREIPLRFSVSYPAEIDVSGLE